MVKVIIVKDKVGISSMLEALKEEPILACDVETTGLNIFKDALEGIGIGTSKLQYYLILNEGLKTSYIKRAFKDLFKGKEIILHNAKFDLKVFEVNKLPWPEKIHDTMIMSWLVDENVSHGLKPLTKSILGREVTKWDEVDQKISLFRGQDDIEKDMAEYCAADVKNTFDLFVYFKPRVEELGLWNEYIKVELKTVLILAWMELAGVEINVPLAEKKLKKAEKVLAKLSINMREMAGKPDMNVGSPKQLEQYLFNEKHYPPIKMTPSGNRSTDDGVLNELVKLKGLGKNDFIPMLLEYRGLRKLVDTYFKVLINDVDEERVVHTTFLQHGTRTGRLSSTNPNLQNIPRRDDEWNVRELFIPRKGYKFIIADYSQAELRMLAHLSQDDNMMKVFRAGGDIHAKTMELTGLDRKSAKSINFGIVYGIGPRSLGEALGKSEREGKDYIERFLLGYPQVAGFIKRVQQNALTKGYVTMISKRRRRFYEMRDSKFFNSIQRQAINTMVQGSAADLMKVAMIRLDRVLEPLKAKQLIQIHDEIIVEGPEDNIEEVRRVVQEAMEGALKLHVPLVADATISDCWVKG